MRSKLTVTFLSDWQISSGIGDGYLADSMLVRNDKGLPYIPGRALKGALREGAWILSKSGRKDLKDALDLFFGTGKDNRKDNPKENHSGITYIRSAQLPEALTSLLPEDRGACEGVISDLTCNRIQTALEDDQVKDGSLRSAECGIPGLVFESELEIDSTGLKVSDEWIKQYFTAVCAAVKSMGANRSRGLGNCEILINGEKPQKITLPKEVEALV